MTQHKGIQKVQESHLYSADHFLITCLSVRPLMEILAQTTTPPPPNLILSSRIQSIIFTPDEKSSIIRMNCIKDPSQKMTLLNACLLQLLCGHDDDVLLMKHISRVYNHPDIQHAIDFKQFDSKPWYTSSWVKMLLKKIGIYISVCPGC